MAKKSTANPKLPSKQYGYVNREGEWVIEPQFDYALPFHNGIARASKDDLWGFIDETGNWIVPPQFNLDDAHILESALENGLVKECPINLADISIEELKKQYEDLHTAIDPVEDSVDRPNKNLIVQRDGLYGLTDPSGNWIVEPLYDSLIEKPIGGIDELYYLAKKNDLWGLINESGTVVAEPRFTKIESINKEKIAPVRWEGHWGIINLEGKLIAQFNLAPRSRVGALDPSVPQTDDFMDKMIDVFSFHDGLAVVQFQYRCDRSGWPKFDYGYIDPTGNLLCEPIFDNAWSFDDGLAVVQVKNKYGIINQEGQYILKPQFNDIQLPTGDSQKDLIPVMTK